MDKLIKVKINEVIETITNLIIIFLSCFIMKDEYIDKQRLIPMWINHKTVYVFNDKEI
jgi:hypothetical protein